MESATPAPRPLPSPHPMRAHSIEPPETTDRLLHAMVGRLTSGISPAALALAWADWALHLGSSPAKCLKLGTKTVRKQMRFLRYAAFVQAGYETECCIVPLEQDRRFEDPAWQQWPFNLIHQSFLLQQQWWHNATTGIGGVSPHHEHVVEFVSRQLLDLVSPVNFLPTNPVVLKATLQEGGVNLMRGLVNLVQHWERELSDKPPLGTEKFRPGKEVATTPGQVVYRNELMELIQYAAQTPDVQAEPVFIVPAWIMKYYILDLSPHNSLVRYLVQHGHTVFILSWHNPDTADRDLGMNDYLRLGIMEGLRAVRTIVPGQRINAVGYCLGGTLLTAAAALLSRLHDPILNSLTLLAAQTDFTEAGELMLFIDDSQLDFLEDLMWVQGTLDNRQMAGAFKLLRSHDLIFSRIVNQYLLGKHMPMNDLMAWNADATRMPYRMHSEYLRHFFLRNELFQGRYTVDGRPVSLSDIHVPLFAVGTEKDHVAPWRSVYKINLVADTDVSFALTSGGHNAGIVSEPGHPGRHYRLAHHAANAHYLDPDTWVEATAPVPGSWWEPWQAWLAARNSGRTPPPAMGDTSRGYPPLGPAPGQYVFER